MKYINANAEIIEEKDPFKKIEMAARTCYKSEKNITENSAIRMVEQLIKNQHYAMLEHATFIFYIPLKSFLQFTNYIESSKFSNMSYIDDGNILSTNLRAIIENNSGTSILCRNILAKNDERFKYLFDKYLYSTNLSKHIDDLKDASLIDEKYLSSLNISSDELDKHIYRTFRIICDRGVTHELVRHRLCSFAQESTRYVNYAKSDELQYISPSTYNEMDEKSQSIINNTLDIIEKAYIDLIDNGLTPQQARVILPQGIKSEIIVTANKPEWDHIFDLRYHGTTGAPHPDMKYVMTIVYDKYCESMK